jgi:hypothetical protein
MERLQKSAATVARRARIAQVIDIGAAVAVSAVVIMLVLSNPRVNTFLMGAAAILVLLAGNVRLRKVRKIELQHLTGGTEDMLDQSIIRVGTTLRHHRFGLIGILPAFVVGTMVALAAGGRTLLPAMESWSTFRLFWVLTGLGVVGLGMIHSLRSMKRAQRELERLETMREAYRHERESTDG